MTKEQAIQQFWSSFGVPAYDENTVPDGAELPYITYEVATDAINYTVITNASIWGWGKSWQETTDLLNLVSAEIGLGGTTRKYDGGLMWIKKGTPFARRTPDSDDSIRHISMNIETDFISEV